MQIHHRETDLVRPSCTSGLALYQTMLEKDRKARLGNQQRLRDLEAKHGSEVEIFMACGLPIEGH